MHANWVKWACKITYKKCIFIILLRTKHGIYMSPFLIIPCKMLRRQGFMLFILNNKCNKGYTRYIFFFVLWQFQNNLNLFHAYFTSSGSTCCSIGSWNQPSETCYLYSCCVQWGYCSSSPKILWICEFEITQNSWNLENRKFLQVIPFKMLGAM